MLRSIRNEQRLVREIAFEIIDTAGTPSLGEGKFSGAIVDNGVGDYTINFTHAFNRRPICVANSRDAAIIVQVIPLVGSVQLKCYDAAGVAADANVDLVVKGFDAPDQNGV